MRTFFKQTPQIDFLSRAPIFVTTSIVLAVISCVSLFWQGLNLGVDFRGGSVVQVKFDAPPDNQLLQDILEADLAVPVSIINLGAASNYEVLISFSLDSSTVQNLQQQVAAILQQQSTSFEIRRLESIGPKIGSELRANAWYAVLLSLGLILLYMTVRFHFQFGIGAILALVHDTLLTVGAFSLLRVEFDLTALAGILTLVGYSMNDTIVVFDRVRENKAKYPGQPLKLVINRSVNEMLNRTIITSATTFIVILAIFFFGGESVRGFSFAFLVGMVVGTYSSIFIASPAAITVQNLRDSANNQQTSPKSASNS